MFFWFLRVSERVRSEFFDSDRKERLGVDRRALEAKRAGEALQLRRDAELAERKAAQEHLDRQWQEVEFKIVKIKTKSVRSCLLSFVSFRMVLEGFSTTRKPLIMLEIDIGTGTGR